MTDTLIAILLAFICISSGFLMGAITVGIGFYSQLRLLRGMIIDKHTVENRKAGIKTSAVKEIAPVEPSATPNKELLAQLVPPDLFKRRSEAEEQELENAKRRAATAQLVNDM